MNVCVYSPEASPLPSSKVYAPECFRAIGQNVGLASGSTKVPSIVSKVGGAGDFGNVM